MKNSTIKEYSTMFKLMGNHKRAYILIVILSESGGAFIDIALAFGLKQIADYFINGTPESMFIAVTSGIALLSIGCLFFPYIQFLKGKYLENIMKSLRSRLYEHMQQLPMIYFDTNHSADILSNYNKDIDSFQSAIRTFTNIIWGLMGLVIIVPYILSIRVSFGLIALGAGILAAALNIFLIEPMKKTGRKMHDKAAKLIKTIIENIAGFRVVKLFVLSQVFMNRFSMTLHEVEESQFSNARIAAIVSSSGIFISWASSSFLAVLGVFMVFNNTIEIGELIGTIPVCASISFCIMSMSKNMNSIQSTFAGVERLDDFLSLEKEAEYSSAVSCTTKAGISLRNVVFGYTSNDPVIKEINLDVPEGNIVALAGYSGGGKSTLLKIIMGLYEIWSDEISFHDLPTKNYSLKEHRALLSYVPQDAYIFSGTIMDNILYGRCDATEEEAVDAAIKANAHEFIIKQIEGYFTPVGESGIKLSGGQRQRIAIARAILKDAPILLLDEATSSLDSESENAVLNTLNEFMLNRTCIISAHRLSTIEKADKICFIDNGRIVEEGTHVELLEKKGLYAELYRRDFEN